MGGIKRRGTALQRVRLSLVLLALIASSCTGEVIPPQGGAVTGHEIHAAPATRAARLTHTQWVNTVRDLLGDAAGEAAEAAATTFRGDPQVQGYLFDNNGESLMVDDALSSSYQQAARAVAAAVAADPDAISALAPVSGADRVTDFVTALLRRAYRRPPRAEEVAEHETLFAMADGMYSDSTGFDAGLRLTLEAVLQSPYLLYRVEESTDVRGQAIPLSDYEIATRLAYALWNTTPDEELLAAADSGEFGDERSLRVIIEAMLDDPRSEEMFVSFHDQLFATDRIWSATPAPSVYPDAPANLAELAIEEREQVIRAAYRTQSSYGELLTQTTTYANESLAAVYGLEGVTGAEFREVSLPPAERRGFFTQIGFLIANATSVEPDPIHRGVFLAERVACVPLGAPPDDIPELPAPMGRTNREVIESHTEVPGTNCAGCHTTIINPFGFPLENYDAVGAWRSLDNGIDIDSSATPLIDGTPTAVVDAVDMMHALAESQAVHACYSSHWVQFVLGRGERPADDGTREILGANSREGDSVRDLLLELLTSPALRTRSREELP